MLNGGWMTKIIIILVILSSALAFNSYRLSNNFDKQKKDLEAEQTTNTILGNLIDDYQLNEASNRAATDRQLQNERKLRNESDERLKRFLAASPDDKCAIQRMSDARIDILRE